MKYNGRPVRTTILYGLFAAGLYLAVVLLGRFLFFWPDEEFLAWLVMAGYGILLARWAKINSVRVLIPFMALLIVFFLTRSELIMILAALIVLGWVRSKVCFPVGWGKGLISEIFIGFGGVMLVIFLGPVTLVSKALAILLFFMVQAGYFVIFTESEEKRKSDPFDKARKQIETILSPEPF